MAAKLTEKCDLAVRPLGVCGVPKRGIGFLEGKNAMRLFVDHPPHNAVGAFPDLVNYFITTDDVVVDRFNIRRFLEH
jgi:hypothetical protein